jgi:serine protease AprX
MDGLGVRLATGPAMRISCAQLRHKATWGSRLVLALILIAGLVEPALAGPKQPRRFKGHHKMDPLASERIDRDGGSDVIVEFNDDRDADSILRGVGEPGRRLGRLRAYRARVSNRLLKRLADDPRIKRVSIDRPVQGFNGRTSVTIGSHVVNQVMGYRGAGIGIAIIDSGITPWHDDLTVAKRSGQRVVHFKDFVNGRTTPYDDWGHGTHVAGIVAGNGYDSVGTRAGVAPAANLVVIKALDSKGAGRISTIIDAIDYVISIKNKYNIRVINLSLGAGVFESYTTDPLTLAAKRAVDAGIVVVAAAGNMGKAKDGRTQYGAIGAPGNAPWVLTVGASSTEGTVDRRDDRVAAFSSRGPTMIDFGMKPDLVAPGTGTVSLSAPGSRMFLEKAAYLVKGNIFGLFQQPYLTLSGTSMATPVVSGTVALMLEANPALTPNLVKAILQFTAQVYPDHDWFSQGAGFLNTRGAVQLAEYFRKGRPGMPYPRMRGWSQHVLWGNYRVRGGVLTPGGTAWASNIVWGDSRTPSGSPVVWGENCYGPCDDNIVWGNNIVWGDSSDDNVVWGNSDGDNVVWGNNDGDNVVWGNSDGDNVVWGNTDLDNVVWGNNIVWGDSTDDNVVWGNGDVDNVVWGNSDVDNVVWGNDCGGADCDNVVWGNSAGLDDNVVWGNAEGLDNIVWGNSDLDNVVWGNSDNDNVVWGNSGELDVPIFGDETAEVNASDPTVWDILFEIAAAEAAGDGVR